MSPPEQAPDGSIVITPKEFYDGVRQDVETIKGAIVRVETAVSPIPKRIDRLELVVEQNKKDAERRIEKNEDRLDAVNVKLAWFTGAGATLGAIAGALLPRLLGS